MPLNQERYAIVAEARPIVTYRNEDELLHWDGCLLAFLCFASWVLFAYLWARLHWINQLEKRQSPKKSEQWLRPHNWRN